MDGRWNPDSIPELIVETSEETLNSDDTEDDAQHVQNEERLLPRKSLARNYGCSKTAFREAIRDKQFPCK